MAGKPKELRRASAGFEDVAAGDGLPHLFDFRRS